MKFSFTSGTGGSTDTLASEVQSSSNKVIKASFRQHLPLYKWLMPLAADYSIIVAAFIIAAAWGWPAYPVSILLLGIAQHRIGILAHDGAHGLICDNKKLNDTLAQILCFWPLLFDINGYRKFHWDHHRNTGEEGLDPELHLKQDRYQLPMTKARLFGRFLLDLCGGSLREFVEMSVYMAKRSNPLWAMSFLALSFTLSFYFGHPEFIILFLLSKPTAFWATFRLRIYIEHVGAEEDDTHRVHLSPWQRFLFAPHNTWMHWEHHKHPQVPFWQLPSLRSQYKDVPVISFDELLRGNNKTNDKAKTASDGWSSPMPYYHKKQG